MLVTKQDYEIFVEILRAEKRVSWEREPDNRSSKIAVEFSLKNGVEVTFSGTALEVTPTGNFYGRHNTWTHIKFEEWALDNVSLKGKGARGPETRKMLFETLRLLAKFETNDYWQ